MTEVQSERALGAFAQLLLLGIDRTWADFAFACNLKVGVRTTQRLELRVGCLELLQEYRLNFRMVERQVDGVFSCAPGGATIKFLDVLVNGTTSRARAP